MSSDPVMAVDDCSFMKPIFLVYRFCLEDCLFSIPVFMSILASEMSAFDPAQKAFFIGIGFDGRMGLLFKPGPPLVLGLERAYGGRVLLFKARSFFGVDFEFLSGKVTPLLTSLEMIKKSQRISSMVVKTLS